MATMRQKKVIEKLVENGGKSVSKAMRDAGYSAATAKSPQKVTRSKSWKELMQEYFPDDVVAAAEAKQLNAARVDHYVFPLAMSDEEITAIVLSYPNTRMIRISVGQTAKRAYFWAPDNNAVAKSIDRIYKLKGSYSAEKITIESPFEKMSEEELDQRLAELEQVKNRYSAAKSKKKGKK